MKLAKHLGLAIGLSVAAALPARAQFDYTCSLGSFTICASVRLQSVGNTLTMQVWNLSGMMGDSYTLTSIGLYHAGSQYDWSGKIRNYTVSYNGTDITSYWSNKGASDVNNLGGVKLELKEGTQGNAGIIGCFDPGGQQKWATCRSFANEPYVQFTFNLNEQFSLTNAELRFHAQQLPDGSSIKCDTGGSGDYPECEPVGPPPTTVPEPGTIVLMGTGLASLWGVARRRRKKAQEALA